MYPQFPFIQACYYGIYSLSTNGQATVPTTGITTYFAYNSTTTTLAGSTTVNGATTLTIGSTASGQTMGGTTAAGQTIGGTTAAGQTIGGTTAAGQTTGGTTAAGQTIGGSTAAGQIMGGSTGNVTLNTTSGSANMTNSNGFNINSNVKLIFLFCSLLLL
jgi:hypothetical protein